jgi:hypothetical protein
MDFSHALLAAKAGAKITRKGWNGKGMYVVRQKGYPDGIEINKNTAEATGGVEGALCVFQPYLMLCAADQSFVPWVVSQSDVLGDDWSWEQVGDEVPQWENLDELREDSARLHALYAQGVDSWEGYGDAMARFREEHGE